MCSSPCCSISICGAVVDAELTDQLEDLAAGLETTADGSIRLAREPNLPKYDRQLSGYYWQIESEDTQGDPLALLCGIRPCHRGFLRPRSARFRLREIKGPRSERLRLAQRTLQFEAPTPPVTFSVAADLAPMQAAARQFSQILALALVVLGVGLVSALVLQVRVGLRPLDGDQDGARPAIRAGTVKRLSDDAPTEIAPACALS
jgi:hypothetical protein